MIALDAYVAFHGAPPASATEELVLDAEFGLRFRHPEGSEERWSTGLSYHEIRVRNEGSIASPLTFLARSAGEDLTSEMSEADLVSVGAVDSLPIEWSWAPDLIAWLQGQGRLPE